MSTKRKGGADAEVDAAAAERAKPGAVGELDFEDPEAEPHIIEGEEGDDFYDDSRPASAAVGEQSAASLKASER